MSKGSVIWVTGLSGAGKSTLARRLVEKLRACERAAIFLDGDELRDVFSLDSSNEGNHGRSARLLLAMRYAYLCRLLAAQGHIVVIATISLFHEIHDWNRQHIPGYFEVYLKVPLEELRKRDPKQIYRRFDLGEIHDVAGLDLLIDEPQTPDLVIDFESEKSVESAADLLIKLWNAKR